MRWEAVMYAMKNLENMKMLASHAPEAMTAFVAFDRAALAGGALSTKVKELMAIAVALTTQCPYCIELHSIKARESGATESEIAETVWSRQRCGQAERSPMALMRVFPMAVTTTALTGALLHPVPWYGRRGDLGEALVCRSRTGSYHFLVSIYGNGKEEEPMKPLTFGAFVVAAACLFP